MLRGVNLNIAPGEHAVVGTTGAGKTTLAKSPRDVAPGRGRRHGWWGRPANGVDVGSMDEPRCAGISPWSRRRSHLLGPARQRHPAATGRDRRRGAQCSDVVGAGWATTLPNGLDTQVGEGGIRLSAVQEQTIALARLVLADPDFAILDEATAEAGSAGAHVLESSAEAALNGRGALIVAHRLSQAEKADRILVMEHGRVVEEGTHADLVAAGGRYAELWEAWSG